MPSAPRRPTFFDGRVLSAEDLEAEQSYFLGRGRSDNRWLHGWGVVFGLAVTPSGDGGVVVEPGLAIDGLGREIVVPERRELPDLRQQVDSEVVTVCLAYAERPEDDGDPPLFVRETYTLEVRPGPAEPAPPSPAAEAVLTGSPDQVETALCEATPGEPRDPKDGCVPLATVDGRKGQLQVTVCPRRTLPPTDVLLELILGLLRRVQALEQRS